MTSSSSGHSSPSKQDASTSSEGYWLSRLSAIHEIGRAIHNLSASELLDLICAKASDVMEAQACSLMLREADTLVIRASCGLSEEVQPGFQIPRGHQVAWHVAVSGQPVLLNESPANQIGDLSIPHRTDIESSMCVPLQGRDGRNLGVISIRRMRPGRKFTEDDLRLFSVFADQAALAISNSDLYSSLNQRVQEMATLAKVTAAINSTLDLDYVLGQIAESIIEVVGFDRCIVYLMEHRLSHLEARVVRGFSEHEYPAAIRPEDSVVGLAAREQIVIFAEGEQLESASQVSDPGSAGAQAVVAAPIVVRRQTIGVVVADNRLSGQPANNSQVELLTTFVNHAGLAIENSSLYEAMEEKYAELNVLYELSRTIGSAYGLDNAVELLLQAAEKAVPYDSAAFALVDSRGTGCTVHSTRHNDPERPGAWQAIEKKLPAGLLADLRDPRVVNAGTGAEAEQWRDAFSKLTGEEGSLLFMPLIADGRTVGVLMLLRWDLEPFTPNNVKLLSIISSHASVVIKNAVQYERSMQEKVLELSALYALSQRISTAGTLNEAFDSILAIVSDLVQCDECRIYTVEPEKGQLELRASLLARSGRSEAVVYTSIARELATWVMSERKALLLPDVTQDQRFHRDEMKNSPIRSLMSIPLLVQEEVVGVLSVHSYAPTLYSEEQVRILSVVASQAASIYRGLEALTALTSYTDNILASVAAGVVTLDAEGTILSWNRAATSILSIPEQEAVGEGFQTVLERINPLKADAERFEEVLQKVLQDEDSEHGLSMTANLGDDRELHLTFSASQLRDSEGASIGVVLVFEDVTSQVHMQEEMRRMGELAAIGQLAASIAHELRNPLSSIKGAAQFLQQESEDPSTREFLGIIVEEVNGLNKIATDFLDFARPLRVETTEVRLADLLERQVSLLGTQLAEAGVTVELEVEPQLPSIRADQKQLEQVFLNLVLNAIQAMAEGGQLWISARHSARWPHNVEVSVRDSGPGIPQERLEKIFTPFFTTKIKGTGLGLPVVQKIVQNHQGHIELESREGQGALFKVHLPIHGPQPSLLGQVVATPDLLERT